MIILEPVTECLDALKNDDALDKIKYAAFIDIEFSGGALRHRENAPKHYVNNHRH